MKKKTFLNLSLVAVAAMGVAVAWAKVPPPPVNQNLGLYDTKFDAFTVDDCKKCHGTNDTEIAAFHHALINSTTPPVSCINASGTLPATLATGCHILEPAPGGGFQFQDFRNCLNCHTTSPHHTTTWAQQQDCKHCHGSVIDNPNDGHYIPSYAASSVTPLPGGRAVANPNNPGTTVIVNGCRACHQADPTATPAIFSNQDTHHGTNIGNTAGGGIGECTWCHDFSGSKPAIRGCEACHGVNSLHNIQVDSPAAANLGTISPGNENLGYGHIGNNWDCQGCHWSWFGNAVTSETAATAPFIKSLSSASFNVGSEATLTIAGESFTNTDGSTTYTPEVTLTAGGNTITLKPFSVSVSEIKVLLPALQQGVYDLRVIKSGANAPQSNKTSIAVVPDVTVKAAMLGSNKTLTITGAGFGATPPTSYKSGLGVFVDAAQAKVLSWSDTKIVCTSPSFVAGKTITVKTLFGPTSGTIFAAAKKSR